MKNDIKFTLYIPPEVNEKVEFLRYKRKEPKNSIVLKALEEYLTREIKKHPDFKE